MAGGIVARLQNQAIVLFTITAPKHFNFKTQAGKVKVALLLFFISVLGYVVLNSGGSNGHSMMRAGGNSVSSSGFGGSSSDDSGLQFFDDDEDDEGDDDHSRKGKRASADDDDEDEDDEDGDAEEREEDEEDDDSGTSAVDLTAHQKELLKSEGPGLVEFFNHYHTESEIHEHLDKIARVYGHLGGFLKSQVLGKTSEGKDIKAYVLGKGETNKGVFVVGTEHGSEWTSATSLTYFVMRMVQLFGIKQQVTDMMTATRFYVVPISNPDGFEYTHSKSHDARYWYKNRATTTVHHKKVHGTDIASDWKSFTQLETQAIKSLAMKYKSQINGFVSVRCCGGVVSIPRKKTCSSSDAAEEQHTVGKLLASKMSEEVAGRSVHKFSLSNLKESKSTASGMGITWAQHVLGTHLSFNLNGRPASSKKKHSSSHDKSAVVVPESGIVDSARDIAFGLLELGSYIAENNVKKGLCGTTVETASSESEEEVGIPQEDEEENSGDSSNEDEDDGDMEEDVGDDDDGDVDSAEDGEDADESEENDDVANDEGDEDDDDSEQTFDEHDNNESSDDDIAEEDEDSGAAEHNDDDDELESHDEEETNDSSEVVLATDMSSSSTKISTGDHDLDLAMQFSRLKGINTPALSAAELPPADGSGPYVLYFAYSVDMYYNVLLNAGVTSAKKVVNARLWGYGYDYTYYSRLVWHSGVADIVKKPGSYTMGALYRIAKSELETLDAHNLVHGNRVERIKVNVSDKQGNRYDAITYRVKVKTSGTDIQDKYKRFHPSRQYRNCVLRGAKQQHISTDYIEGKLSNISPMFSDKIGSMKYRNERLGTLCDVKQ